MPLVSREAIRKELGRLSRAMISPGPGVQAAVTSGAGAAAGAGILHDILYSTARDQHIRVGSVIAIMNDTDADASIRGQRRFATASPTSTGAVSVSPSFSAQVAGSVSYEAWIAEWLHPDEIDLALDRALARMCWRWIGKPVTHLPGGDIGDDLAVSGSNVVDNEQGAAVVYTPTNATLTLVELNPPDEWTRRVLAVTASAANGYAQSATILADPDERDNWRIEGLIREVSGTSPTISIVLYDVTNGATFSADNQAALQRTARGWGWVGSNFTLPDGCDEFAVRLQVSENAAVGQFGWLQLWNQNQRVFHLPRRIASREHVGPIYEREGQIYNQFRRREYRGRMQRRDYAGRGVALEFSDPPNRPLWYYERVSFPALTSDPPVAADDDNETWAPLEWVVWAALVECYELLRRRDALDHPERWQAEMLEATGKLLALQATYGPEPMFVEDSSKPRSRVIVDV